jgi:1-acyl-sn-glycerol-3-phosphate acyltransferase
VWLFTLGAFWTVVYGTHMIAASVFKFRNARCICDHHPRYWALKILKASTCPVTLTGQEHIDPDAPQILVANHESWFDVFVLAAHIPGRYRFVAKKELEKIPIFGPAIMMCGHITVDRGDRSAAIESLEQAAQQIRSDNSTIVLFPEGTRTRTGDLQKFKKGAFVLAIQARVPIVPVAIRGTRAIMPKGAWRIRPGPIDITIGEPIPVEGLVHDDRDVLRQQAYAAVATLRGGVPGAVGTDGGPSGSTDATAAT